MKLAQSKGFIFGFVFALVLTMGFGTAFAEPDYDGMVTRIENFYASAMKNYKAGNKKQAKLDAEAAYFQVFENMEGPIRVNISARKNYYFEGEFSEIRKMIVEGKPIAAVDERVQILIKDLRAVAQELKGGFVLQAEPGLGEEPDGSKQAKAQSGEILAAWKNDLDLIRVRLKGAVDAVKLKDRTRAQEFVLQALFDGYIKTLLEEGVKKHESPIKAAQMRREFLVVLQKVRDGESTATVERSANALIKNVEDVVVGLPLIRGAVAKSAPLMVTKDTIPNKDWRKIGNEMMAAVEKAMKTFKSGDHKAASLEVQSIYFDIFEGTKLEVSIGVLDQVLMVEMEAVFGNILRGMAAGASEADLREEIKVLNSQLEDGLALLKKAKK